MSMTRIPASAPTVTVSPRSEGLREAAGRERTPRELAVHAEEHATRQLGPVERGGPGDPMDLLRVPALVHAVLGPRTGVVLGARDLAERHVARGREPVHAVAVGVA